jgi:hypothetical protein
MSTKAETVAEEVGQVVGVVLGFGLIVVAVIALTNITLPSFSFGSKWMTGNELVAAFPNSKADTAEAEALIASFDRDNGSVYCVPKMKGEELGNFRAGLPAMMIQGAFAEAFSGNLDTSAFEKKPMESVLRMTFTKKYACK